MTRVVSAPVAGSGWDRVLHQLPLLGWLVLIWNLLWGTWSWANLISGLLVAAAVTLLVPLPPVTERLRPRPVAVLAFLGHFLADLVVSGAQVAWQAVRLRPERRAAVIVVPLRIDSDLLLTTVAEAVSLIPGSLVLDLDREHRALVVHLLAVRGRADIERERAAVLRMEDRVVRAFGSAADIAALDRAAATGAAGEAP